MAEKEEKVSNKEEKEIFYRFVVKKKDEQEKSYWEFIKIPKGDLTQFTNQGFSTKLIRYAVFNGLTAEIFDTKEEAREKGKEPKPVKLDDQTWEELTQEVIDRIYNE